METDISKKANYIIKYGVIFLIFLSFVIAWIFFHVTNRSEALIIRDAKVAGTFVSVKARADGKLQEIKVTDGDFVNAGDVLATMEVSITEDTIAQLEKNVALAKENLEHLKKGQDIQVPVSSTIDYGAVQSDLARAESRRDRMEELFKMGAISKVQRDEALKDYEAAKARASAVQPRTTYQTIHKDTSPEILESAVLSVRQAEAALKRAKEDAAATDITSPIDGTFYLANINTESDIKAGERLFNIGDATNMWIEARLSDDIIQKIYLGQLVSYEIDGKKFSGTITEIEEPITEDAIKKEHQATDGTETEENESDGKRVVKISLTDNEIKKPGTAVVVTFH